MRAHRTLDRLPDPRAGPRRAGRRGGQTPDHRRLDLRAAPRCRNSPPPTTRPTRNIPAPQVSGGQSDIGISGAANGSLDIGDSSRDPIVGVDPSGLVFTKIARDGVCVITNSKNPISNLSQQEVEGIFTGKIHDWSEVPGARVSGPIDLFQRDGASGTEDAFQHIFLGEYLKISPSAVAESSNGLEQLHVEKDEHGIGFVSFAYTAGVNAVGYQGVACNLRNARSGQYEGVRNFWMVTKGAPKGEAAKFISWVTSGKRAGRQDHQLELDRSPLGRDPDVSKTSFDGAVGTTFRTRLAERSSDETRRLDRIRWDMPAGAHIAQCTPRRALAAGRAPPPIGAPSACSARSPP